MPKLVLIDIQRDFFEGGASPLPDAEEAASVAATLLAAARRAGAPVIHSKHNEVETDEYGFVPGSTGAEPHPSVAPDPGEPVFVKHTPNALLDPGFTAALGAPGTDPLVVCGMMTNLCVDSTVRAASDLGHEIVLVSDACAASPLEWGERQVVAPDVHAAFLAGLSEFATIAESGEALASFG